MVAALAWPRRSASRRLSRSPSSNHRHPTRVDAPCRGGDDDRRALSSGPRGGLSGFSNSLVMERSPSSQEGGIDRLGQSFCLIRSQVSAGVLGCWGHLEFPTILLARAPRSAPRPYSVDRHATSVLNRNDRTSRTWDDWFKPQSATGPNRRAMKYRSTENEQQLFKNRNCRSPASATGP